jgi:hypothetical protein
MSDIDTTTGIQAQGTGSDGRTGQAKQMLGQAGQALKSEAQTFASAAQEKARAEALKQQETATKTLGDFANAIRRAGDELSNANQSPAARLIGQAADGLENLTRSLEGKQPEDLLNDVRGFARSHPLAFISGAVLVGVALGRFVRASESNAFDSSAGYDPSLADEVGAPYPVADTSGLVGAEATGAEALGLTEEDGFDGEVELGGAQAGIETAVGDDLGDLQPSDVDDTSGPQGGPRSL